MCVGEKRRLEIPPELGYASQGNKNIYFYNELLELSRGGKVLASTLPQLKIEDLEKKEKCEYRSQDGDTIHWHYKGTLDDGTVFDEGDFWAELDADKIIKGNKILFVYIPTLHCSVENLENFLKIHIFLKLL